MNDGRGQIDSSRKAAISLVTAHGNALELLEFAKEVLNQMPPAVHVLVNEQGITPPRHLRDHNLHTLHLQLFEQTVGIKCLVSQQGFKLQSFEQLLDTLAVVPVARQQHELDQIALRIAQGQYLGADAPA